MPATPPATSRILCIAATKRLESCSDFRSALLLFPTAFSESFAARSTSRKLRASFSFCCACLLLDCLSRALPSPSMAAIVLAACNSILRIGPVARSRIVNTPVILAAAITLHDPASSSATHKRLCLFYLFLVGCNPATKQKSLDTPRARRGANLATPHRTHLRI